MRQRRNRTATRATLKRTSKRRTYAPRLPDREWHPLTRAWWKDVWHSPMAEEFLQADVHALFRLAVLVDMFWRDPSDRIAKEIRLEQQAFGLTPIDRRRLQWSVEDEERERRTRQVAPPPPVAAEDPRTLLKVVAR